MLICMHERLAGNIGASVDCMKRRVENQSDKLNVPTYNTYLHIHMYDACALRMYIF